MNTDLTIGVEEEFLLVAEDGQLSELGPSVIRRTDSPSGELQRELAQCQLESATKVCRTAEEVVWHLRELRSKLAKSAAKYGTRVVASGTPIMSESVTPAVTPDSRYQRMAAQYGAIISTGNTCGSHVHVYLPDKELAVQVSNHVRPWLPLLIALTANSPFYDGEDTAYSSWRHVLWSRWPSAGPPPVFASLDEYESSVDTILRTGAMLDRGMVYWDIRLSENNPTLEFRVCDVAATPEDAALAAAIIRALVARAQQHIDDGRAALALPPHVLRANLWRAAHDGLDGSCATPDGVALRSVSEQLRSLIQELAGPLTEFGDWDFVQDTCEQLWESGSGARRQRTAFEGRRKLTDVVDAMAVRL
jgi:carboxylate-amine ligase